MFDPEDYDGKCGFTFALDNGFRVSVRFGSGNYCENYWVPRGSEGPSRTAETAVIDPRGSFVNVQGGQTANQVLATLRLAAEMKADDWQMQARGTNEDERQMKLTMAKAEILRTMASP